LRGATVFYNTYWVRFNHATFKHSVAVENTLKLIDAAERAGVERFVHVSITNPSEDSDLEYFRGKARLERVLMESGLSYAILRPTVLFGYEDILINNLAWALRNLPIFGVFGKGDYRLQPIYVDDLAQLAVTEGESRNNRIIDAIGPETFTYRELVHTIAKAIGVHRPIISVPPGAALAAGYFIGKLVGDVMITRDEIEGLMRGLLCTDSPPAGKTRLTDWSRQHARELGARYANELARRKNRDGAYETI
jgi:NADH dehydrogenase